ncbi:hypothetical protein JZ751_017544 [Albula glossodonta]|uniref:Dynein regulatory complex subunit 2 n=1 Tax=Albula glossodonta TaxID=121402 RepID=A0A8T2PNW5_9TELE|nr:hypothetical protein JZ751_017544 [Albula glossodonta]
MGKKGKKKKGKGKSIPMTEEERELYLKQKALAEEEAAMKKQAMLTSFLKDKLQKEEQNSITNLHKLTDKWRIVFRHTCVDELRRDIAVLSHTFERVVGHKDSIIKFLVSDLQESKQQSARALCSYVQCVDQLLDRHRDRASTLEQQWDNMLEDIRSEFEKERNQIISQHEQECKYLEEVNFAIDQYYSEVLSEVRQDFQSTCVDLENKNTEERNTLRVQLEGEVEMLWMQVQHALRSYTETTEDQYITLGSMQAHDQQCTQEIDAHMKKLHKLQDSITALRSRLGCSRKDSTCATGGLRAVKEEVTLQGQQLKLQMCSSRIRDKTQLTSLIRHCNTTTKKIQAGERLLRVMEACRKMEKEREKVYICITQSTEEQILLNTLRLEPMSEEMVQNIEEVSVMEAFWEPYNTALKECQCLQLEQQRLTEQSRQLRTQLRLFLEGITVGDQVMRQRNPLLIVTSPPCRQHPREATSRISCSVSVAQLSL